MMQLSRKEAFDVDVQEDLGQQNLGFKIESVESTKMSLRQTAAFET